MSDSKKLKIVYAIDGKSQAILVSSDATVDQVVEAIRKKHGREGLRYIFQKGSRLRGEAKFKDFYNQREIYIVAEDLNDPAITGDDSDEEESDNDLIPSMVPPTPVSIPLTEFVLYITLLPESMLKGTTVNFLENTMNLNEMTTAILRHITTNETFASKIADKDNIEIHLYLPNGIQFISGTFEEWSNACEGNKNLLYVVVTRKLNDLAERTIANVCDCSSPEMKLLLSPLCDSTLAGYTQIASLLGYFFFTGPYAEELLLKLAAFTGFAPFITCLYNVVAKRKITGLSIATICASLQSFIQYYLPDTPKPELFQKTLAFLTLILKYDIKDQPNLFEYNLTDEVGEDENTIFQYFRSHGALKQICVWAKDQIESDPFKLQGLTKITEPALLRALTGGKSLRPISPLSLQFVYEPTFVRLEPGRDDSLDFKAQLFIENVLEAGKRKDRMIKIINPIEGNIKEVDYDDLARAIHDMSIDKELQKKGDQSLQQIIYIVFDASASMRGGLDGKSLRKGRRSRFSISKAFLKHLLKRFSDFRIRAALGLVVFGENIVNSSPLSISQRNFVDALNAIQAIGSTMWYDAVSDAADLLIQFNKTPKGHLIYPDAQHRIILISDADDTEVRGTQIEQVLCNLASKLTNNNILLDQIMLNHTQDCTRAMAVSKITGGLCFLPPDEETGIELFETEAFIDITTRSMDGIIQDVTPDMFTNLSTQIARDPNKYTSVDTITQSNIYLKQKEMETKLGDSKTMATYFSTPEHYPKTIREIRILDELIRAAKNATDSLKVYASPNNISQWRVFILPPPDTPYSGVWYDLSVYFPDTYPRTPPIFRFVTVPYHQNTSKEGKILCSAIEEKYKSSIPIYQILNKLRDLFAQPEDSHTLRDSIQQSRQNTPDEFNRIAARNSKATGYATLDDLLSAFEIVDGNEDQGVDLPTESINGLLVSMVHADGAVGFRKRRLLLDDDE